MNQNPEQIARDEIDQQLSECGWLVQGKGSINLAAGIGAAVREYQTSTSPADYVLFVDKKPVGIIEAKEKKRVSSSPLWRNRVLNMLPANSNTSTTIPFLSSTKAPVRWQFHRLPGSQAKGKTRFYISYSADISGVDQKACHTSRRIAKHPWLTCIWLARLPDTGHKQPRTVVQGKPAPCAHSNGNRLRQDVYCHHFYISFA